MATIHDVMPAFELFQPASIDDALSLLERHRRSVWVLAGGLDTFDWLKDRNKRPQVVIDLSGKDINDTIHISDVTLPAGTTPTIADRDFAIANIQAPSGLRAEESEAEAEEAEG